MVGIIDYKAGNSHSVYNACTKIETECKYISKKGDFSDVSAVILPGVGSAKATMDSLRQMNIIEELNYQVNEKKIPFLGICVGLQILFEYSEEDNVDCLGWIPGQVIKYDKEKLRVPQIGWNKVVWKKDDLFLKNIGAWQYLYFVNSYYAKPANEEDVIAVSDYGGEFCAMIKHDNIYAAQCHVEKSGFVGLQLLKNFCTEVVFNADK